MPVKVVFFTMLSERSHRVLVLTAYAALVVAFFHPVVFGGKSLLTSSFMPGLLPWGPYGGDPGAIRAQIEDRTPVLDPASSAWTAEPWAPVIGRMYRSGEVPLWNPFMGTGMPFAANMQSGVFFPPRLAVFLWPSPVVWNAYLLLRLVVLGVFMYEFLRLLRVSPVSAFAGGMAFMFTGHFVLHVTMWHLDVELFLPALMLVAERLIRARTVRTAAVLGMLLAASILGGSPESLLLIWLFVGSYYAFRAVAISIRSRHPWNAIGSYARPFALAVALGLIIASPLLVLFAEYLGQGFAPVHHAGARTGEVGSPLNGAISLIIPYFFDHLSWHLELPPGLNRRTVLPYLGIVPVALAALAPRRRGTVFFGAYAAISLLKAYAAPVVNLIGIIPGFSLVIFFKYNQPILAFCVATLMAFAMDALSGHIPGRCSLARVVGTVGGLVTLTAAFVAYHAVWVGRTGWMIVGTQVAIAIAVLGGLAILVGLATRRSEFRVSMTGGVVALLAVELFQYVPRALPATLEPFRPPPFVDVLRRDPAPFRVYGIDSVLHPNTGGVYGVADVRAVEAMYPTRYLELVRATVDPRAGQRYTAGSRDDLITGRKLFDLLNVRYLLSIGPIEALTAEMDQWQGPVVRAPFSLPGAPGAVLLQPVPSRATRRLRVPDGGGVLRFRVGVDEAGRRPGDGVRYRVQVETDGGAPTTVFETYVDPANLSEQPRWRDSAVDLSAYRGQTVGLVLLVEPGGAGMAAGAGWGDLRLESPDLIATWRMVYDGEVKVYRNERALPRAFVVHRAVVATSSPEALAQLTSADFDPRRVAIVEEPLPDGSLLSTSDAGESVEITHYGPHDVALTARLRSPGLLVLGDTFYPHWRATVDGRAAKIYRADVALRAVLLGSGVHEVRFSYRPAHFYVASLVSLATAAVSVVLIALPRRRAGLAASGRRQPQR